LELFLLKLHGGVRWLAAVVAAIAGLRFAIGWARRSEFKGLDRRLMAAFTGLLDLNVLLGLVLLLTLGGGFPAHRLEHATTMLLAVVVAHLAAIWRRSDQATVKFRGNLGVVAVATLLVVTGVVRLRGGWVW
jgi:hypothetical protein